MLLRPISTGNSHQFGAELARIILPENSPRRAGWPFPHDDLLLGSNIPSIVIADRTDRLPIDPNAGDFRVAPSFKFYFETF